MEKHNYKVFVTCWTYNQSKYIKDTMDGFSIQKTDFPFVCAIIDDASTDGEPKVIQNYLDSDFEMHGSDYYRYDDTEDCRRVFAQHKTNKNCFFLVVYLKYNHYQIKKTKAPYVAEWSSKAEYQALCEGDDYWIDPLKLQKQVAFMDTHPDHSMCFHPTRFVNEKGDANDKGLYDSDLVDCNVEDYILCGAGAIRINSVLYSSRLYTGYSKWAIGATIGDGPLCLTLFENGEVAYINDVMSVTRVNSEGSWHQNQKSSLKLRHSHYLNVTKLWKQYDGWSNGKHHRAVRKKIWINRKSYYRSVLYLIITKVTHLFCKQNNQ